MKTTLLFLIFLFFFVNLFSQSNDPGSIDAREVLLQPYLQSSAVIGDRSEVIGSTSPEELSDFLREWMLDANYPGMSVSLLKNGNMYWKEHFGIMDITTNMPVNDSTTFLQCSISKTVEITAIMKFWEQGFFQLDDDINDYLDFEVHNPLFPDSIITFRMLMTHTSSIRDHWPMLQTVDYYGMDSPISLETFLKGYLVPNGEYWNENNYYDYSPSEQYNYTNVGAATIGYLVEIFSGLSFENYCWQNIFEPLGMYETSFFLENINTELLATMHYQSGGSNLIPFASLGVPYYPAATLKTSAINLSKFLGMYLNNGTYNGITILQAETIEIIQTLQDVPASMGLIWFYDVTSNLYNHSGGWTLGATSYYGFDDETNTGFTWMGNSYPLVSGNINSLFSYLTQFSDKYEEFSIGKITWSDSDGDKVIEAGEEIELVLEIRNNMNAMDVTQLVNLTFSTDNPFVEFTSDTIINYGNMDYLGIANNSTNPLKFTVSADLIPTNLDFNVHFNWDNSYDGEAEFSIPVGPASIIVIDDESDERGEWIHTVNYYKEALDSIRASKGVNYAIYDIESYGDPDYTYLSQFPVIIWFTGYDSLNTITSANRDVLSQYLDGGGKLFITGQNISEDINGSSFLADYLHAEHKTDNWDEANKIVGGINGDPVGDDLFLKIYNSGTSDNGANNQESSDVIIPVNNGEMVFEFFFGDDDIIGVRYEADYKLVFLSFGYEAISASISRYKVMKRILEYFELFVGIDDGLPLSDILDLSIFPNPTTGVSMINYKLICNEQSTMGMSIDLDVFDSFGRQVATLIDETQSYGSHHVQWDTSDLPAGVYLLRLQAGNSITTEKVLVF